MTDLYDYHNGPNLGLEPTTPGQVRGAGVAQPKRRPYNASGSLSEYGIFPECDAAQGQPPANAGELPPMPAWMRETVRQALVHLHDAGINQGSCDAALNWLAAQASGQAQAANADALDAARYRLLRKGAVDDVAVVRGLGSMDYGMSAVVYTHSEELDGDDLDAVIDAAMQRTTAQKEPQQ